MLCKAAINIVRKLTCNNARMLYCARSSLQSNFTTCHNNMRLCNVENNYNLYVVKRFKTRRIKHDSNDDKEDSDESDDETDAPVGSKVVTVNCSSIRLDNIAKAGFGMSRNKVEEAFYGSKIRVNGEKVLRKSKEIHKGDEIDMILSQDANNTKRLVVNRIVILTMKPGKDTIQIKLCKDKNLLIEDYAES